MIRMIWQTLRVGALFSMTTTDKILIAEKGRPESTVMKIKKTVKRGIYLILYHLHLFDAALVVVSWLRKEHPCIILLYHRIVDDQTVYLDKGPVVHHHIRDFEREIAWLKKRFRVLSMDEVVDTIRGGKYFAKPSVAITFDDGYLDNYTLAYPVLKSHGVPAMIYLATGLIGTNARTWPDQIEAALLASTKQTLSLPGLLPDCGAPIKSIEEKRSCCIQLSRVLKGMPDAERKIRLVNIFRELDVTLASLENSNKRTMLNWDEVKEMSANKISFGSHSHTHPILSRVPLHEAQDDIRYSKQVLEVQLGGKVRHFAYPNGRKEDFSEDLRSYCKKIGFDTVATVVFGTVDAGADPFSLKRIGVVSPVWNMAGELTRKFIRRAGDR
ncbi:polysaccharide deacetylase [Geobacter metallireducens RCH3]|uniref:polysaccharide deacetylase family protein n=1 Tax=Geobacter metallireducens TaxID=28232 RepID=UPI000053D19B|nr:polysaccharide deacetylase family protein [Geobacter metallireducens]EHP86990.1 polysaccharide deacetylase [Geobacter metallireducens RCH3]